MPSKGDLTSFAAITNFDVQALSEEQLSIGKYSQLDGGAPCVPFQIALQHVKKNVIRYMVKQITLHSENT